MLGQSSDNTYARCEIAYGCPPFRRIRRQTSIGNPHVAPQPPVRHRNHPYNTTIIHAAPQSPCNAGDLARDARLAIAAQKKGEPKGPPFLGAQ